VQQTLADGAVSVGGGVVWKTLRSVGVKLGTNLIRIIPGQPLTNPNWEGELKKPADVELSHSLGRSLSPSFSLADFIRTWAFQLPLWSANGFYYYLHTCCSRGIVLNKNSNFHTCSRCAPCSFVLVRVRSCSAGAASANWQSGKTDVTTSASRTFPFPLPLPAESPFAHRLSRPLSFTPAQAFRLEFAAVRVQVRVGSGWSLNWMPSLGQGIWFLLLFIGAPQDNATERARGAKANQDSWQMWPYQQQIVIDSFRLVNDANFQRPEIS